MRYSYDSAADVGVRDDAYAISVMWCCLMDRAGNGCSSKTLISTQSFGVEECGGDLHMNCPGDNEIDETLGSRPLIRDLQDEGVFILADGCYAN